MRAAVYYHSDFAEKGYITLRHRVKPGFDGLQDLIKAGHLEVLEPVINAESRELLANSHTADLIKRVKAAGMHEVALLSASGVIQAAEKLHNGSLDFAFCFVGTAGHHAGKNYCWGFCYYNDVAMAVKKLKALSTNRIMIIDVDPHSGDGTRDFVARDANIIHINFFEDEDYPYEELNYNNYGILLNNCDDKKFLTALDEMLVRDWDFEFLIMIFGHDSHSLDYGDFNLTFNAYQELARKIRVFARGRPVLWVLSGGSNPQVAATAIPTIIKESLGL
ncbi:MAG: histone deacetylase [Syntrophomonadaceae bacterium]|jgi:acetoin utilization deacetylase AcuC-like enzyme|nr:histone deacetylase [Syntrophomonadaceae bacterium]